MTIDPREVAILTIHGHGPGYGGRFADRFPWERLQLDRLRITTPPGYTVIAYGNDLPLAHEETFSEYPEARFLSSKGRPWGSWEHVWPLRNWLVRMAQAEFRFLVTLDSDAFPVHEGWLEDTLTGLSEARPLVAVQRLENGDTHSDRCFMAFTSEAWRIHHFDFSTVDVVDAGAGISRHLEEAGLGWRPLRRSNAWNPHPLTAAIYDDAIYHHAAGSRLPRYRSNVAAQSDPTTWEKEVAIHAGLLELVFEETDEFLSRLRGSSSPISTDALLASGRAVREAYPDAFGQVGP